MAKPTEGKIYVTIEEKTLHGHRQALRNVLSDLGVLTCNGNVRNIHLEFPCRYCRRQTPETLLSSSTSDWGWRPRFLKNVLPELLQSLTLQTGIRVGSFVMVFNPLNAELNPFCHLLAFLGAHRIFHFSGLRVNEVSFLQCGNPDQWTGGSGPTAWPAPPADLNSLGITGDIRSLLLTLNVLMWRIRWAHNNARK